MDSRSRSLELIHRAPPKRTRKPALLFVHGAYVGAWCWDVHFLSYLAARGYPSYALSLRGHGGSACDREYATLGIDDYVDDLERTVATLGEPPVLIGHSMGGLVVMRYLARPGSAPHARSGVLMAPVPLTGLTPSLLGLAWRAPLLLAEMNQVQFGRPRFDELTHIRRALFSAGVEETLIRVYFARMQRESQRALIEMSMLHFSVPQPQPPVSLLVLGAANDGFFVPEWIAASARRLAAPCEIFADMAHAMMLDARWREVADRIADWVERPKG